MIKVSLGLAVSFLVGVGCRWFDVPVGSPPNLIGAMLVVAMSLGYVCTDLFVSKTPATTKHLCGGPSGSTADCTKDQKGGK
jgi:XapX domain-containing protein